MSFTNILFLFWFLPISLAVYYIAGKTARPYVLTFVSLLFYACGSLDYLVLFLVVAAADIAIGRIMQQNITNRKLAKALLILGIAVNIGVLGYYKYSKICVRMLKSLTHWSISFKSPLLPLGISFFTFKAISYLIDIYREKAELSESPINDLLYLSFFAQIQSGPLSRYQDMAVPKTLVSERTAQVTLFSDGVYRFMIGFNKKVLLSNVLCNISDEIFAATTYSKALVWLGAISYSLQLYYDFSGYSDMAIGISQMFGYHCPENFFYPYMTESVAKFWRRWHITLSGWFRDYIYIPLGGSRTDHKWKIYRNLFVVWLLTGIWHGASVNFVLWGLGYFVLISFERLTGLPERLSSKPAKILYRIAVLLFINFEWVMFRAKGVKAGFRYIKHMLMAPPNALATKRALFLLNDYKAFLLMGVVLCFPLVPYLEKKLGAHEKQAVRVVFHTLLMLMVAALFVWALSLVIAGQNNPFAYANF